MNREDLNKIGFAWAANLGDISITSMFEDTLSAVDRLAKAEDAVRAARGDLRAARARAEKRITDIWTPAEIAEAKTRCG